MIVYEDGEQFNVPPKWLEYHDKQVRADTLEELYSETDKYFKSKPKAWWHWTTVLRDLWKIKNELK